VPADTGYMDTTEQKNRLADARAALERQNREVRVQAQLDMLRAVIACDAPVDNLLLAIETMLMDNLQSR